jgi:kynureninase
VNPFSRSLGLPGAPLHVAAHSHHPWPDASHDAQIAAWDDAARLLDRKWDHMFGEVIPAAQRHVARQLSLPDSATLAFGPNTHGFVMRILSCLPRAATLNILTTDSEFMSLSRQLTRLEAEMAVSAVRVPTEPFETFEQRFVEAARRQRWDVIIFSQVFFDSGYAVQDLAAMVAAMRDAADFIVVDGYHGFMAVPTDLGAIADRAFYIAGGYKYAMAGEGACFLHAPPDIGLHPRDTGWFAGFSALESGASGVPFAADGSRFLGATFDVSALYRFNAVQDWLAREGWSVETMLAHVRHLEEMFLQQTRSPDINRETLMVTDPSRRGRFLAFRTPQAGAIVARLAAQNIIADHRGDRLRIGFGIYHGEEDARHLAQALT